MVLLPRYLLALIFCVATVLPSASASGASASVLEDRSVPPLLTRVIPSVVAIHTKRVLPPVNATFGKGQAPRIERAEGSGFIVSQDGFIATNKHVVAGAYAVEAVLADGKSVRAEIVYESPVIDVAFLRLRVDAPLAPVSLARDDALELGQRVIAVGNPDGLGISASAGIVSALDRNLKQSPYDRYVQTDAAINPGSSGGPLFDLNGEVVGMNSIAWTQTEGEGSNGLGFAIPSSSIAFLIDQLREGGRIRCGTLGVSGQKLTGPMQDAIGYTGANGIIIASIRKGSAAARAGLRVGEVIETFDGVRLRDVTALNHAACFMLGRAATMEVWRNGESRVVRFAMTDVDDITGIVEGTYKTPPRFLSAGDLGLTLQTIDEGVRSRYRLGTEAVGVVVTAVAESSEAEAADLSPGDVIKSLQMVPLTGAETFDEVFRRSGEAGRSYLIALVGTKGGDRWITLPARLGSMRMR